MLLAEKGIEHENIQIDLRAGEQMGEAFRKINPRCTVMSIAHALRNSTPAMKDRALPGPRNVAQIPELAARGQEQIKWFLEDLNTQLTDNSYVAGEHYSVADITATVVVDFAKWVKVMPNESQTALLEWHERMKARPSYTA